MLLLMKPQSNWEKTLFPPVPDPWDLPLTDAARWPTMPRMVPLDPSHEITGGAIREALMPQGLPGVFQLSTPMMSVQSAIAILLSDEIKLADQATEPLRHQIEEAIALLELNAHSANY